MNDDQRARVRALNDRLRRQHRGGQILLTCGVLDLGRLGILAVIEAMSQFDAFTPENDRYGEHDFGALTVLGHQLFWKIDYLDPTLTQGAEDPADEETCRRVLTVMLAGEY